MLYLIDDHYWTYEIRSGQHTNITEDIVSTSFVDIKDDQQRPELLFCAVHKATHAPFQGFNRAQSAVIEAAVLVSRLQMLPQEKIRAEIDYLTIAIEKTAGPHEQLAWDWLLQRITGFYAEQRKERLA